MTALDFFENLPSTQEQSPVPEGKARNDDEISMECCYDSTDCANCDCVGVNDCASECQG